MAIFKSVPGSETSIPGVKFDKKGFFESKDPEIVKQLEAYPFVEKVGAKEAAAAEPKVEEPKPAPKPAPKAGKGGK